MKNLNELPQYWTDDLKGVSVFGAVKDTAEKCPETIKELKEFLNKIARNGEEV